MKKSNLGRKNDEEFSKTDDEINPETQKAYKSRKFFKFTHLHITPKLNNMQTIPLPTPPTKEKDCKSSQKQKTKE